MVKKTGHYSSYNDRYRHVFDVIVIIVATAHDKGFSVIAVVIVVNFAFLCVPATLLYQLSFSVFTVTAVRLMLLVEFVIS